MKHAVIGTAGHVDHGKTTLIRALTGVNTDRLREEQDRGMTIELGFAPLTLPSGRMAGVVDVPGHERFIKNMLAGASGVDVALVVVAADEGVMPQTEEHLDILELLGVRHGVVAITKSDLVEEDWLELAIEDVRGRLAHTRLAGAPVLPVSAVTGQGLDLLLQALDRALDEAMSDPDSWSFARLPIDRVFAISGHGTVVTGTLVGGAVRPGDKLELLPARREVRVRGVQVHDAPTDEAVHGQRVAMNLSGVDRDQVERGMVLARPGMLSPSRMYDAELDLLPSAIPVEHRTRMRLHMGTAEVMCRVRVIGAAEAIPGERAYVQLELEEDGVAARGDRFIIRTYSPSVTAGGGRILAPASDRRRRMKEATIREFEVLAGDDEAALARLFASHITSEISAPASAESVAREMVREQSEVRAILESDVAAGGMVAFGESPSSRGYMPRSDWDGICARMEEALRGYHSRAPLRAGMPKEQLRTAAFPGWDGKAFSVAFARAVEDGLMRDNGVLVSLPEHEVTLTAQQRSLAERLEAAFSDGDALMSPPERAAAIAIAAPVAVQGRAQAQGQAQGQGSADVTAAESVLDYMIDTGVLMRVGPELLFHRDALERAMSIVKELGAGGRAFTAAEFRDACGSTRKYAVALLECLDSSKVTRRVGDERVLGSGGPL
ncbi:MAG: selenocysteine-specific translation elongation factor [Clostridia bacterium]|nr:selenocysteine-specific translation elongation factor [Clostridia bacterium]